MTTKSASFVTKFTGVLQRLLHFAKAGGKPVVFEEITMAINGTKDYNLVTLLPDNALYDLKSARITCWLLDEEVGSDTNSYYINAESTIVAGIRANGAVRIRSYRDSVAKVLVRIDRPFKKL